MFLGIHTKTRRDILRVALDQYRSTIQQAHERPDIVQAQMAVIDGLLREINAAESLSSNLPPPQQEQP